MIPASDDLTSLAEVAREAATAAGAVIAAAQPGEIEVKASGTSRASKVVTEVDRRSEALIIERLTPTFDRFGIGLLTEERDDDGGRLTADLFWCVDPLDGTLAFVEGRRGYAVSVALVRRDGTPLLGVVHDPVDTTTWHAVRGQGIHRNGDRWAPGPSGDVLAVFADQSLLAGDAARPVTDALDRAAARLGLRGPEFHVGAGAVLNACGALTSGPACYLKLPAQRGGGSLWDFAATACLFHEAGAIATDVHGARLDLNRPDSTFMNHRGVLFASDVRVADALGSTLGLMR